MNTTTTTAQEDLERMAILAGLSVSDVRSFANGVRAMLGDAPATHVNVAIAAHEWQQACESNFNRYQRDPRHRKAVLGALAGTYDEFRAEAK